MTNRWNEKIKHESTTHGISNKGFSGMRRVVARFNFLCNLIENHPQSLTGHTVNVMCNPPYTKKPLTNQANEFVCLTYKSAVQCKADFRTVTNEYERNPG
jgi:hypothetical protein